MNMCTVRHPVSCKVLKVIFWEVGPMQILEITAAQASPRNSKEKHKKVLKQTGCPTLYLH